MFLIRWLIAALLCLTLLPLSWQVLADTWTGAQGLMRHAAWVLGGLGLGLAWVLWRRPNWFVHTLIHETCHALACLLLGVRIRNFQASDGRGGAVIHDRVDPLRSTLIALAPYTLPLLLGLALLARWLWNQAPAAQWLSALVGFAYIHHLHGLYHNVRLNFWGKQADLSRAGKPLSVIAIASCLLLVTALSLWLLYRS